MISKKSVFRIIFPIAISLGITVLLFWKSFIGMIPFPGNYLIAWYEPWKSETSYARSLGIAHKPVLDDVFRQLYPYKILIKESIQNGSLPLWNPYNGSGMPLLATMHAGFFTPTTLLFLLFTGHAAWTMYIMLQPILFSLGCWWYTRKLGFSRIASVFSIVTFLLSGFAVVRYEFGEYLYVASCLPYILAIIEQYRENTSTKLLFLIPCMVFFMMISGQPQMVLYVLLISGCYALSLCRMERISIFPLGASFLLGMGLSAVQLLPTLELYRNSNMTHSASQFIFDRFLLPIDHFITLFIPNFFGNPATYNFWERKDYVETALYMGMIPIFFVTVLIGKNVLDKRRYVRLFYEIVICLTFLLTLNWPLSRWIYSLPIPIIGTGIPSRFFFLTAFSIAILAGMGFDNFLKGKVPLRKPALMCIGIISIIVIFTLFSASTHVSCLDSVTHNCWLVALRDTTARNIILECVVFGIALFGVWLYKKIGIFAALMIMSIYCFSGLYNANKFLPFSSESRILPSVEVIDRIKQLTVYDRIVGVGDAEIPTNIASYFRFFDPQYYEPLYLKRYGELFSWAKTGDTSKGLTRSDVTFSGWDEGNPIMQKRIARLMQLVSVGNVLYKKEEYHKKQINSGQILWEDDTWIIAKNTSMLPHISVLADSEVIADDDLLLKRLFDDSFDPTKTVLIEEPIKGKNETNAKINTDNAVVGIISYKENFLSLRVASPSDGLLVITDNYYPGWRAFVDDKEVKIYRANYAFRAISVPEGEHTIIFTYQPNSITLGSLLSVCTAILIGIFFILRLKK